MAEPNDNPGVLAPPPLIFAGGLAGGVAMGAVFGLGRLGLPAVARILLASASLATALALVVAATRAFRRADTNLLPTRPTTAIVTAGVYGFSRNPIYVALTLAYLGAAFAMDSIACLLLLVPVLAVVRVGVIAREEAYLGAKFGAAYRDYKARVRRWI